MWYQHPTDYVGLWFHRFRDMEATDGKKLANCSSAPMHFSHLAQRQWRKVKKKKKHSFPPGHEFIFFKAQVCGLCFKLYICVKHAFNIFSMNLRFSSGFSTILSLRVKAIREFAEAWGLVLPNPLVWGWT